MGQAFSYGALGRAYRRIGRHDEALDSFGRDLAIIARKTSQDAPRIQMHCEIADVQRLRGDYAAAMQALGQAAAVIHTLPEGALRRRQEAFAGLAAAQVTRAHGQRHRRWRGCGAPMRRSRPSASGSCFPIVP